MSTDWGLDLDMSAVRLMRRTGDAWDELQSEAIDSPDIEERLNAMLAQIDDGAEVTLFLPLDQILCTDVELSGGLDAIAEIEAAMDGRTPYALDELVLDWELSGTGQAKVAAIARDTLDEAAAFAEVRGIGVAAYSSLGLGESFPRLPRFDGPHVPSGTKSSPAPAPVAAEPAATEPAPDPKPEFATARKPSRAPTDAAQNGETLILKSEPGASLEVSDKPVVQVDDATPVMLVKGPALPLNPGTPVMGRVARPRVRTDIAAGAVSGRADTLSPKITPGGSVRVHRRGSPLGTTALVFAAAFVFTIGIATLVWNILPFSPDRTSLPTQAETGVGELNGTPEPEFAAAPEALPDESVAETEPVLPEPDAAEETEIAALPAPVDVDALAEPTASAEQETPDLPQPTVFASVSEITAPESEPSVTFEAMRDATPEVLLTGLAAVTTLPGTQPDYDATPPLALAPEAFASILTRAPIFSDVPNADTRLEGINLASFVRPDLTADAIALPSIFGLSGDELPQVTAAPEAPVEEEVPAQVAVLPPLPTLPQEIVSGDVLAGTLIAPEALQEAPGENDVAALIPDPIAPTQPESNNVDGALADAVEQALTDALAGPGGLIPTEHAAALPETAPRARPQIVVETSQLDQFGGRTLTELAVLRPTARPASEQQTEPTEPPSALAVARSLTPRLRPADFGTRVAAARVQLEAERLSASVNTRTPDTSSAVQAALETEPQQPVRDARQPNIPTSASVARQATVENAIRLNRVNLVGVYGVASDRRALVRLPSGRYVKVKVGDRVDGGTVAQITDSELFYRKGSRTLSLAIPQS